MLPFQRTFISSYPKATQDTHQPPTHATSKLGNWLNLKMFLYLIHLFLTERFRIFNPSLRVARERYATLIHNVLMIAFISYSSIIVIIQMLVTEITRIRFTFWTIFDIIYYFSNFKRIFTFFKIVF